MEFTAKVEFVRKNGWGQAIITEGREKNQKIAIPDRLMNGLHVGSKVRLGGKKNTRWPQQPQKWFCTKRLGQKSEVAWAPWQTEIQLPNTRDGADHTSARGEWGFACWKCGAAQLDASCIGCIHNTAVWTNTAAVHHFRIDEKKSFNRYKKCEVQSVFCANCNSNLGSYYAKPFHDSKTGELTTRDAFPCFKLDTVRDDNRIMVVIGPDESSVEDILVLIEPAKDEAVPINERIDAKIKRELMKMEAQQTHAAARAAQTPQAIWRNRVHEDTRYFVAVQSFRDFEARGVLGSGCNGSVFHCDVDGKSVAVKMMYNYGSPEDKIVELHSTEYRFLKHTTVHYNIVAVLGTIPPAPAPEHLAQLLPPGTQELLQLPNGNGKFRTTTGLVLEYLPLTLEKYVGDLGRAGVTPKLAAQLASQVVAGSAHLKTGGVIHGDMKTNNIMVDPKPPGGGPPRVVLVDFGCAVVQGTGPDEMDAEMVAKGKSASGGAFTLGNPAHTAPEVLSALRQQQHDSERTLPVPLGKQGAFATGIVLYELAMQLQHPIPDYPSAEDTATAEAFDGVDYAELKRVAGEEYAAVTKGLLAFDPQERLSLAEALDRMQRLV